jgi:hypothetical protein
MTTLKRELRRLLREFEERMRSDAALANTKAQWLTAHGHDMPDQQAADFRAAIEEHELRGKQASLVVEVLRYLDTLPNGWFSR